MMPPRGGTEILWGNFRKYVDQDLISKVNILLSVCDKTLLKKNCPNILWQHVNTDQRVAQGCNDIAFVNGIDKFVYVSEWQRQKYHNEFNLPYDKSIVLLNAIDPIPYVKKTKGKLKLIYTSTPWRGLEILLESFKLLNRKDIELDVYSSTVIYGSNFMPNQYDWLFNKCRGTPGVNYKGYALNKGIRRALQSAHILAYPSIFEETSCLAAIEAGAAGCQIVTTNLGALPETCDHWASYVQHTHDVNKLIHSYAEVLNSTIDNYWHQQDFLYAQSICFNDQYSWHNRKNEWNNLLRGFV